MSEQDGPGYPADADHRLAIDVIDSDGHVMASLPLIAAPLNKNSQNLCELHLVLVHGDNCSRTLAKMQIPPY